MAAFYPRTMGKRQGGRVSRLTVPRVQLFRSPAIPDFLFFGSEVHAILRRVPGPASNDSGGWREGKMRPEFKVWVVFGDRVKLGDGRARLLELIEELGSIKKAVARIGMSYRNAWGYFRELEQAAGFKLLERTPGGGPRGGTRLTKAGKQLLKRYWRFRRGSDEAIRRHFARSFKKN
jgi:molybdate transport system regulatory protein